MIRLPAEWEPQAYVLMSFPRRDGDWADQLERASEKMVAAANAIAAVCPVIMIVGDTEHFNPYAEKLDAEVRELPTDDCWARDFGPLTVFEGDQRPTMLDFTFNGWGGKFSARNDNLITQRLHRERFRDLRLRTIDFVLEGGGIESDGAGTIMTTSHCLQSPGRHPEMSKAELTEKLRAYLGCDRVLWLDHGELDGDDTDAHIDTLARFLSEDAIAYVRCDDPDDPHFPAFQRMEEQLKTFRTPGGTPYRLIPLPWPPAIHSEEDGHRLPASYANFLISNGIIFVPAYFLDESSDSPGKLQDKRAAEVLREATGYRVEMVDCRSFIEQHGALHCLTMQIPEFKP
ncbi:agmatine/peptidylarginine deiminase [Lewinella sp. W8]|uniref:agmatine deiminase family protein n=1 Tax=Lewinella sp. W8 TaxID=2528208 RepID=UPI0010686B3C|nr:agmatine deiminase family protein [Lewinella sp. W8]MTB52995.1 agmatine deiminase [Lewinella sp. W8]